VRNQICRARPVPSGITWLSRIASASTGATERQLRPIVERAAGDPVLPSRQSNSSVRSTTVAPSTIQPIVVQRKMIAMPVEAGVERGCFSFANTSRVWRFRAGTLSRRQPPGRRRRAATGFS